jgi:hypothetical protein
VRITNPTIKVLFQLNIVGSVRVFTTCLSGYGRRKLVRLTFSNTALSPHNLVISVPVVFKISRDLLVAMYLIFVTWLQFVSWE